MPEVSANDEHSMLNCLSRRTRPSSQSWDHYEFKIRIRTDQQSIELLSSSSSCQTGPETASFGNADPNFVPSEKSTMAGPGSLPPGDLVVLEFSHLGWLEPTAYSLQPTAYKATHTYSQLVNHPCADKDVSGKHYCSQWGVIVQAA